MANEHDRTPATPEPPPWSGPQGLATILAVQAALAALILYLGVWAALVFPLAAL